MKRTSVTVLLTLLFIASHTYTCYAWGFYGHQHITRAAIFALPQPPGAFFYNHADFLTEEAVVPDLRKHVINDKMEPYRHYVDLEGYNYTAAAAMPQTMQDALTKYGKDTLQKYGILPWYIQEMMAKLTDAFKHHNKDEILFIAGDLSHYIGDAFMPLHTSIYYDGQQTNQKGIHAFWESQLPELFGDSYDLHTEEAHYIKDIPGATWDIVAHSHTLIEKLLSTEKALEQQDAAIMYEKDSAGNTKYNQFHEPVHSKAYAKLYHDALDGMVQQQMKAAAYAVANFWYTAWVNAGKPDLTSLDAPIVVERNKNFYKEDKKAWEQGKIPGLKPTGEFDAR